ncbi:MAG: hypothetical protein KAU44_05150 [Candidatus Marinimicrobia bacterium]|nr:hypothetical protein [Candidatus Neomarinimicrobiota bacterium]
MKRSLRLLFIIILLASCGIFAPNSNNARINSLTQYEVAIEGIDTLMSEHGEIEISYVCGDTLAIHQQFFNRDGMVIEETSTYQASYPPNTRKIYEYHRNGSVSLVEYYRNSELVGKREFRNDKKITYFLDHYEEEYSYNRSGKIQSITHHGLGSDSLNSHIRSFEYDSYGNITRSAIISGDVIFSEYVFSNFYDSQKRISKIDYTHYSYGSNGTLMAYKERDYAYNDNGYEVQESSVYQGRYGGRRTYVYNNEDELIKKIFYDENDDHVSTITDFYLNEDYKILEYTFLDSNDLPLDAGIEYAYENDNITGIIEYSSSGSEIVLSARYDNNNVIEYQCTDHFYFQQTPAHCSLEQFDSYFHAAYTYPLYWNYYYNISEMKYKFDYGHYIFSNYNENGIWETKVEYDLDDGNPIKISFQEFELY